jgi:hypothetical protein
LSGASIASGRVIDIENLNDLDSFNDLPRLLYPTASVSSHSTDTTNALPSLRLQQRSVSSNSTNSADTVSVSSCDSDEDRYEDMLRKSLSFVVDSNPLTNSGHVSQPIESSESFESSFDKSISSTYATLSTPVHESKSDSGHVSQSIKSSESCESSFDKSISSTYTTLSTPVHESKSDSGHVSQSIESSESFESSFDKSISSTYATLLTPVHESKSHVSQLKNRLRSPSTFSPVAFQNNHCVLDPTFVASLLRGRDTKGFSSKTCTDVVPIIMDTGCSFAMTFDERDFVEIVHGTFGQVQTAGAQLPITVTSFGQNIRVPDEISR